MWKVSSSQRSVHASRQLSARRDIDKGDTWFILRFSPVYNEMLWKRNIQAVRMEEVETISSTLRSVYALQADICQTLIEARYTPAAL